MRDPVKKERKSKERKRLRLPNDYKLGVITIVDDDSKNPSGYAHLILEIHKNNEIEKAIYARIFKVDSLILPQYKENASEGIAAVENSVKALRLILKFLEKNISEFPSRNVQALIEMIETILLESLNLSEKIRNLNAKDKNDRMKLGVITAALGLCENDLTRDFSSKVKVILEKIKLLEIPSMQEEKNIHKLDEDERMLLEEKIKEREVLRIIATALGSHEEFRKAIS